MSRFVYALWHPSLYRIDGQVPVFSVARKLNYSLCVIAFEPEMGQMQMKKKS